MITRPIEEYHEDMGPVLWWKFPIEEPPYVGTPNDLGFTVEADILICLRTHADPAGVDGVTTIRRDIGGWPGYHTHFTMIEVPIPPPHEGKSER